jgi:thymidylate synthase
MENSEGDPDLIWNQKQFIEMIKTDDEFAKQWGELGPIYGRQWRNWNAIFDGGVDQIKNLIQDLKTNPDSRRLMVNAWNVGELDQMVLPPCHYGFQMYTRVLSFDERWALYSDKPYDGNGLGMINTLDYLDDKNIPTRAISLMWNQRSVDTPLGLPFNIASYALLLEILARETNMIADQLIGNLGDCHIYLDQQDGVREQLTRSPMALGQLVMNDEFWNPDVSLFDQIEHIQPTDFYINDYHSHPTIKFPLSN